MGGKGADWTFGKRPCCWKYAFQHALGFISVCRRRIRSLDEIGITTSGDYEDHGRLIVDETALANAIESAPESVMNLFCQQSASYPGTLSVRSLTSSQRQTRTGEEGLAFRLFDILQDNISTYTDSNGNQGTLIEKAGYAGTRSEYDNMLTGQIEQYDEEIADLSVRLDNRAEYYYERFSIMETYINQMNFSIKCAPIAYELGG